jgi:serine/threonine protein kinase
MGEVYKAKDTRLGRIVAIKVLLPHIAKNSLARERFEREAKTVSALDHPHICTLFDVHLRHVSAEASAEAEGYRGQVGEEEDIDYMVMEYLEGETLADRLKKGALPLDKALLYATQLADGLDAGHRAGLVHRDFKPGNIMLTRQGAKIMDYGLAKLASLPGRSLGEGVSALPTAEKPLTEKGAILGTFQYMPPEQLEERAPTPERTSLRSERSSTRC